MSRLAGLLLLVAASLAYTLVMGRGGIRDANHLHQEITAQAAANAEFEARNRALAAEVMDLKEGLDAVEELARSEMGMVRQDEIFFQMIDPPAAASGTLAR